MGHHLLMLYTAVIKRHATNSQTCYMTILYKIYIADSPSDVLTDSLDVSALIVTVAVISTFRPNTVEDPSPRRGTGEVVSQRITPHRHCVNVFKKTSSDEGWICRSRRRLS